jgi:hypothetical protein
MSFKHYLEESAANEDRLTHIEHAEDHVINSGEEGFHHAFHTLNDVHHAINGATASSTKTSIKYDGSPSVVFGHHPGTKKFFVSSKAAFNKQPKINYSPADIDTNHGHMPGLAHKLKSALEHLPKVTPNKGVFQGDIMYTKERKWNGGLNDVTDHGDKYHFTPNTITYSQKKDSPEGKKIAKAKIGVAVHTSYSGGPDSMKALHGFDAHESGSGFKQHPDVHLLPVQVKHSAEPANNKFEDHMKKAVEEFHKTTPEMHDAMTNHRVNLKTYINNTVKSGAKPSASGYSHWLGAKHEKEIDQLKTANGKAKRKQVAGEEVGYVNNNKAAFQHVLNIHHHLQNAKNELVHSLSDNDNHGYQHSILGNPSKPEGFVAVRNNRPTKLVDRSDFSKANFAKVRS